MPTLVAKIDNFMKKLDIPNDFDGDNIFFSRKIDQLFTWVPKTRSYVLKSGSKIIQIW